MPIVDSKAGLKRIVGGVSAGLHPVDVEEAGRQGTDGTDAITGQVRRVDLLLGGLIDVAEAKQFVAVRTDVAQLENRLLAELLLKIHIEVLHVGRADMRIDAKRVG